MGILVRTAMAVGPGSAPHPEALHPDYALRAARRNVSFNPAPSGNVRLPIPAGVRNMAAGGKGLLRYAIPAGIAAGAGLSLAQLSSLKNDRRLDNLVDAPMTGAY